jgi:5-methylcytosine-specific restriction endonuclease McrA
VSLLHTKASFRRGQAKGAMRICKNENCEKELWPTAPMNKLYCSTWCRQNQGRRNYKKTHVEEHRVYQRVRRDLAYVEHLIIKDACLMCGEEENLHVHHIIKINAGGGNQLSNLMMLCSSCHSKWHRYIDPVLTSLLSEDITTRTGFRTVARRSE